MSEIERKVGRHHLAFYRGWLQGVDLKTLSDRYLETGIDLRIAKSLLVWLKDFLTQAALRNGKRGEARLQRTHLARNENVSSTAVPSINEYRETNDPDFFYREEELIKMYGGKSIWEHSIDSTFIGLMRSVHDNTWVGIANALQFAGVNEEWINEQSKASKGNCEQRQDDAVANSATDSTEHLVARQLRAGITAWRDLIVGNRINLAIHGIAAFLSEYCKPKHKPILQQLERSVTRLKGTLGQRLAYLSNSSNKTETRQAVQLMTLHASKGLEFDNVWIAGCEDGNIPHTDSPEEDERRLLYVGMTRARHRLVLSSATEEGFESHFLQEAGLLTSTTS